MSCPKKKIVLLLGLVVVSLSFAARDVLLAHGASLWLSKMFREQGWSVQQQHVQGNKMILTDIEAETAYGLLQISHVDITWHLSLWPFALEPHAKIDGAMLSIDALPDLKKGLPLCLSWWRPTFTIDGALALMGNDTLYALHLQGTEDGTISLEVLEPDQHDAAWLSMCLTEDHGVFVGTGTLRECSLAHVFPFISSLHGTCAASWKGVLSKEGVLKEVQCSLELEHASYEHAQTQLAVDHLCTTFSWIPQEEISFWKQMEECVDLFVTFDHLQATLPFTPWCLQEGLGEIRIHPHQDPVVRTQGTIFAKEHLLPFFLEGSGTWLDEGAYWLQMALSFAEQEHQTKMALSLCQDPSERRVLDIAWSEVSEKELLLIETWLPFTMLKGKSSGHLLGYSQADQIEKIELEHCVLQDVHAIYQNSQFFAKELICSCTLDGNLALQNGLAELHGGGFAHEEHVVSDLVSKVCVLGGVLQPSYVEGIYLGMHASLQTTLDQPLLHIECDAKISDLAHAFTHSKIACLEDHPIYLVCDLFAKEDVSCCTATVHIDNEDVIELEGSWNAHLSSAICDLCSSWNLSSLQGGFHVANITDKWGVPLLRSFFNEELSGYMQGHIDGLFDCKSIQTMICLNALELGTQEWQVQGTLGVQEPVRFTYTWEDRAWKGSIPVELIRGCDMTHHFVGEIFATHFCYQDGQLETDHWQVRGRGFSAEGTLELSQKECHIATTLLKASTSALTEWLPWLDGIQGRSSGGEWYARGLHTSHGWDWTWHALLPFSGLHGLMSSSEELCDGEGVLCLEDNGRIEVQDVHMTCAYRDQIYHLSSPSIRYIPKVGGEVAVCLCNDTRELFSCSATWVEEEERIDCSVKHLTVLERPFQVTPIVYQDQKVKGEISIAGMIDDSFVRECLAFSECDPAQFKIATMWQGALHTKLACDMDASLWKLHIQGQEIVVKELPVKAIEFQIEGELSDLFCEHWTISRCAITMQNCEIQTQGYYSWIDNAYVLPSFSCRVHHDDYAGVFQGSIRGSCAQDYGEGVFTATMRFQEHNCMTQRLLLSFDSHHGIKAEKSTWDCLLQGELYKDVMTVKEMHYQPWINHLDILGMACHIPISALSAFPSPCRELYGSQGMNIDIDASMHQGVFSVQGTFADTNYRGYPLQELHMQYASTMPDLLLEGKSMVGTLPLWFTCKLALADKSSLALMIKETRDASTGLLMQGAFREHCIIDLVKGEWHGIGLHMRKVASADSLAYDVRAIVDFERLQPLFASLSASDLKSFTSHLGSGYCYQGRVHMTPQGDITEIQGKVFGEHFHAFGRDLKAFSCSVIWNPLQGEIKELSIDDPLGALYSKSILLQNIQGTWTFHAPLMHVKDLSLSLFSSPKLEGMRCKNMSLYQVSGTLDKLQESLSAEGSLQFVSPIRSELSLWEIPRSLIKDLGLDLALFNPAFGEVDFVVQKGCVYLRSLRDVYSEGERSQFLLIPNEEAFVSLQGECHVDLQLKQKVQWKLGESVIMSIRGSVVKPKYSFRVK